MVLIPDDFAQATINFGGTALPFGAAITLGLDVATFAGTPDACASQVRTAFASTVLTQLTDDVQNTGVLVKYGPTATGPTGVSNVVTAGGYNTTSATPNVTYLVRKSTAFGGRSGRGRFYLPGVAEDEVNDGGQVNGTFATNMQSELDDFLAALTSADLTPVVLHDAGAPLTIPTPITGLRMDA